MMNLPADQAEASRRPPMVVLRADKDLSYEVITNVISLARSLGLGVYMVTDTTTNDGDQRQNLTD